MTATATNTNGWCHGTGSSSALLVSRVLPMQASAQAGRGQFATFDASGNVALNDGTVPGLVSAGVAFPECLSDLSSIAGGAKTSFWWGYGSQAPASTIAADGFTAADMAFPFFIASENAAGRKSNYSGSNRSIGGLVFGLDAFGAPVVWSGPLAQLVARGALIANTFSLASTEIADAAASTAIAEKAIRRPKVKGTITSIEFTGAAIAADNTDYITVTVSKRDGAGGGAVSLGTYDSRAANNGAVTAFTPAAFTLSVVAGALFLLETDIVTITTVKGGSGKVITGVVTVHGKAL